MAPSVHQLTASKAENGQRVVTVKCGETLTIKTGVCSDSITAWGSMVTCTACLDIINQERREWIEKMEKQYG